MWKVWLAIVLPIQVGIVLCLLDRPFLALATLWALQPVAERVALIVLSRCLFGVQPGVLDATKALFGVGRSGLAADLSLRRLAPTRALVLPVSQLEGLRGWRARERRKVLSQQVRGACLGLAVAAGLCEVGLWSGLLVLASWMLPAGPGWSLGVWFDELQAGTWWASLLLGLCAITVTALVVPVRTAAAFGLYIQRRTVLEGWDVELSFRGMAQRLARLLGGAAVVLALLLPLGASPAHAGTPVDDAAVRDAAAQVLAGPQFGGTKTSEHWRLRGWEPEPDGQDKPDVETRPQSTQVSRSTAGAMEVVLGAVVGIALVGLVLSVLRRSPAPPPPPSTDSRTTLARAGLLGLDGQALPQDPAQAAWTLWQEGQHDHALALLYRAAVAYLVRQRRLDLDDGSTEGDCLRVVGRVLPGRPAAYFRSLTLARQRLAYAHRSLTDAELRALVDGWADLGAGLELEPK